MRGKEEDEEDGGDTGPMLLCSAVCSLSTWFFFLSPSVLRKEYCKQSLIFIIHNTLNIPPYPCIYFNNKRPNFCESDSLNIICIIFHLYSYSGKREEWLQGATVAQGAFFLSRKRSWKKKYLSDRSLCKVKLQTDYLERKIYQNTFSPSETVLIINGKQHHTALVFKTFKVVTVGSSNCTIQFSLSGPCTCANGIKSANKFSIKFINPLFCSVCGGERCWRRRLGCAFLSPSCPVRQSFFTVLSRTHRPEPIFFPSMPPSIHPVLTQLRRPPQLTYLGDIVV